ncbi:putative Acylneuraminate cytidylyltransferase [Roseobacter sp. SK209-2-6]|uniref:pseudaminic acid cytidylyltransferase n=1 Tax=Roseobacter sp. SK209-2-6 TaxID=388739 RepID=UPI0000F3F47C|nr:pseudaminic acid cytidylyltransferase [Roseobacter sp. SK209-2-6]EBA14548.1 putative Acylneuraminate cytidylyltransferase [Roseobacter sp. SK209-2-6]
MAIAVIPARGGSKRIPRKNIKPFCGKPMIAWTIEAAAQSGCFDRIIVSTDDAEIAEVARDCGAETPFVRPPELSDDHTGTGPVVAHAIQWLGQAGKAPDLACCLYATAPFLQAEDIRRGYEVIQEQGADYAFSVASFAFPIQRALYLTEAGRLAMFQPEHLATRSQDLTEAYHDAGQFYWGTAQAWCEERRLFDTGSIPIVLPRHRVQDIDVPEDWERAEWMLKAMQLQKANA